MFDILEAISIAYPFLVFCGLEQKFLQLALFLEERTHQICWEALLVEFFCLMHSFSFADLQIHDIIY